MTRYVLGFMFDKKREKVLLVEKTSPDFCAGKYNGVGGHIERGEKAIHAMVREFHEETGIFTEESEWEYRFELRGSNWRVLIYMAEGPIRLAKQITHKDKPLCCWVDMLPENVMSNLRWIIPFLLDRQDITGEAIYP